MMEARRSLFWGMGRGCVAHRVKSASGSKVEEAAVIGPLEGVVDIVICNIRARARGVR